MHCGEKPNIYLCTVEKKKYVCALQRIIKICACELWRKAKYLVVPFGKKFSTLWRKPDVFVHCGEKPNMCFFSVVHSVEKTVVHNVEKTVVHSTVEKTVVHSNVEKTVVHSGVEKSQIQVAECSSNCWQMALTLQTCKLAKKPKGKIQNRNTKIYSWS